jgi:hypothetical protein
MNSMNDVMTPLVSFLTGDFLYSGELMAFWMAVQGAVAVRKGPNKDNNLHWFHAFCLSVIGGYAGGLFGFIWMGKPTAMLANDLNVASCIVAFVLVNYFPLDLGFTFLKTLPATMVTVSFAQLFRSLGLIKFTTVCFEAFKDTPSAYYPIPVFGPILYATLLGNMGGFFMKGFEGHVMNGMPWPFQNGLFCASFYHFFVHDKTGIVGTTLRQFIYLPEMLDLDDRTFAAVFVALFMQVMGILQIPAFLGPSFSPFGVKVLSPFRDSATWTVGKTESEWSKNKQKAKKASKKKKKNGDKEKEL